MLINLLVFFFTILILFQVFEHLYKLNTIFEGMTNTKDTINKKQYDKYDNDTFILAQKNAGNIEYLKQRMDEIQNIYSEVQDLSGNVMTLQTQVNGLIQQQQDYANQITGGNPPKITGAVDENTNQNDINQQNFIME